MDTRIRLKRRNLLRYLIEATVLAGLTAAVFVPWGCSQTPLGPAAVPTHNTFTLPNGILAYPGKSLPSTPVQDSTAQTIPIHIEPDDPTVDPGTEKGAWTDSIGAQGGVIDMAVEGETSFFFVPVNGVLEKTEIQVRMYRRDDIADRRITEFHFSPDGLRFYNPAMLSYRTALKDGEILDLSWWDPAAQKWMQSAQAVVVAGYVTFPVFHFSDYRTTERVSLGGQRGSR
jgi:hypothetical protein